MRNKVRTNTREASPVWVNYEMALSLPGEQFVVLIQLGAHHHVPGLRCHVGDEVAVKELDNLQAAQV